MNNFLSQAILPFLVAVGAGLFLLWFEYRSGLFQRRESRRPTNYIQPTGVLPAAASFARGPRKFVGRPKCPRCGSRKTYFVYHSLDEPSIPNFWGEWGFYVVIVIIWALFWIIVPSTDPNMKIIGGCTVSFILAMVAFMTYWVGKYLVEQIGVRINARQAVDSGIPFQVPYCCKECHEEFNVTYS